MTTPDDTLTVDIPAAEFPAGFVMPTPEEPPAPKPPAPKATPVVAEPAKPDPRDAEIKAAQDALSREQAERARIQKELDTQCTASETEKQRSARLEAENYKRTGQAIYSHGQATYAEHQQIVSALHACKMELDSAKRELEFALNDDNIEPRERARRIADAQERISGATTDSRSLEQGKSQLEQRLHEARAAMDAHQRSRPQPPPEPEKKAEPKAIEQPQGDPFEAYLGNFPKVSQDWLRAHPEYVKDPKLNKRLQAAALEWDAQDKQLHSAEFVAHLDEKFFPKPKEEPVVTEEEGEEIDLAPEPPAPAKAKSAPAAPVSRSAAPTRPSAKGEATKTRLTVAEAQHAVAMFGPGTKYNLSEKDAQVRYGRNKLMATADGKYER